MKNTRTKLISNNLLSRTGLACAFTGICLLGATASGAIFTMTGSGDILVNSTDGEAVPSAFTPVSGNTLNIGTTGDATGPFAATATTINSSNSEDPAPIINVYGTSSLEFSGNNNATRIQSLTVNFEDESKFLINAGNAIFRERVVINYNSTAASSSTGDLRMQDTATFSVFNINNGSVTVDTLNMGAVRGLVHMNGGDFSANSLNYTLTTGLAKINFDSLAGSTFTLLGAADINALDAEFTDGLFQIGGVDKVKSDFQVILDGSDLKISAIPEPSSFALVAGALALMAITLHRRK